MQTAYRIDENNGNPEVLSLRKFYESKNGTPPLVTYPIPEPSILTIYHDDYFYKIERFAAAYFKEKKWI